MARPSDRNEHSGVGVRRPILVFGAVLVTALGVIGAVRLRSGPWPRHDVWLVEQPQRWLEARVSYPGADRYRPLAPRGKGGAQSFQPLPLGELSVLEERDPEGLAAAYLVRGIPGLAEQALKGLNELGRSANLDNDRAVARLLLQEWAEALRLTRSALAENPSHPQALWNRGLALRELGLTLLAARVFSEVAALEEPGWSSEAAQKAGALRHAASARRERWRGAFAAGEALLGAPPGALPEGFSQIPSSRRLFYDAVRSAPSKERVLALLPVARQLDARAGGHVLEGYVRRVAEADFSRRAPLARDYLALLQGRLPAVEQARFLAALFESKEEDLLLGALVLLGVTSRYLQMYEDKATASQDPWFQLLAAQESARVDAAAGRWTRAEQTLLRAQSLCAEPGLEYRCILLASDLSNLLIRLDRLDTAREHAERGWRGARESSEWGLEPVLLWNLEQVARLTGDDSLARDYLEEFLEHDRGTPDTARRVHQELAVMAMQELRVEEARREIDAALATGIPLSLRSGAFALADIARLKGSPQDEIHLNRALEAAGESSSAGERAIATHVLGRFFIERDVERGRSLLWRAIQEAETLDVKKDQEALRARAYSFTSLIQEAGRRSAFHEALELFGRERRLELPGRCLLAATVDSERTLLVALGSNGEQVGHYDEARRQPLPQRLDGLVPEKLLVPLRGCQQVQVLARPPLHGRAGLLPPELAWSYLTRTAPARTQQPGPAVHLVVSNVELPPQSSLPRLNAWTPDFGPAEQRVMLSGTEATPSRVLSAMRNATEIDLVAHGIISDFSNVSYLLLAPEQGSPELGVPQVRAASLRGAPFVVLAACHAAHTAYTLDAPLSLPAAFIDAGARGVLAATVEIPDLEAAAFFNAVRARLRAGMPPAMALRDERMQWLAAGKGVDWLGSVLLFE